MKNLILDQYRNAFGKYRKFVSRFRKKQLNGAFKELSIQKQNQLIRRLNRLKARVLELRQKMVLAGLGAFLSTTLALRTAQAQIQFELPINPIQLGEDDVDFGITIGPSPAFANLDNDADLDLFLGLPGGEIIFYKNDGNNHFTKDDASNPLAAVTTSYGFAQPTFVDWDKDGDLDLFLGGYGVKYFENTGSASQPAFTERTGSSNPLNAVSSGYVSKPTFADLDGDTDLDAVVGFGTPNTISGSGTIAFYVNNNNTLSLDAGKNINLNNLPFPTLVDVDKDGDLDLVAGVYGSGDNRVLYFQNNGSGTFSEVSGAANPFINTPLSLSPIPGFFDYDKDGDPDLFLGDRGFRGNAGLAEVRLIQNTSRQGLIRFGNVFIRFIVEQKDTSPVFADIDKDNDLDLFVGNSRGQVIYYENTNGLFAQNDAANPLKNLPLPQTERVAPRFADIDKDNDLDVFMGIGDGLNEGRIEYYKNNTGVFTKDDPGNALSSVTGVGYIKPAFVDLDKDSDLDVFVGGFDNGLIRYLTNANGVFTAQNNTNNPLGTTVIAQEDSSYYAPVFVDLDVDGDMDAVVAFTDGPLGTEFSTLKYFRNNGTGVFTELTDSNNPFNGLILDKKADPTFADIDLDGDLDLYIGEDGVGKILRSIQFFENISKPDVEIAVGQNMINNLGIFDFGPVEVGSSSDTVFVIKNTGPSNLILSNLPVVSGQVSNFSVDGNFSNPVIAPGQSLSFTVTFTPDDTQVKTINISFTSNDPDESPFTFTVRGNETSVGIFELPQGKLKIAPNPASSQVQISLENAPEQPYKLTVYDLKGQQVFQETQEKLGGKTNRLLNLSKLASGIYVLRLEIAGQVITERIVVD